MKIYLFTKLQCSNMLIVVFLNVFVCQMGENSTYEDGDCDVKNNVSGEHIKDVIVEVTTTKTVVEPLDKTVTEHLVLEQVQNNTPQENKKEVVISPTFEKDKILNIPPQVSSSQDNIVFTQEKVIVSNDKKKKCFVVSTHLDFSPILDLLKSKNIMIEHSFNGNFKGFSFCVCDDSVIEDLRANFKATNIEEDKIYKTASIQYPISRHLFLINNYLNYVFNNYFYDNVVFRTLQIERLFRYLVGSYNYYYTGKGSRLYMLDTTVDERNNVVNISRKSKSCNDHGNTNLQLIINKTRGFAPDTNVIVLDGVECDGTISLSGILKQLDKIPTNDKRAVLLFGVSGPYSKLLNDTIDVLSRKGLVVISPSGNNHDNACYYSPGSSKGSLTVGSLNKHSNISQFSNFGSCVRVFSLGEEVSETSNISGTSFSAATVAGAVLMFLEKYPTASFGKIWEFINSNSYLNGNTHLVFKLPFLSRNNTSTFYSDNNKYGIMEFYIYYLLPLYILIGILILMYWVYKKLKRRNEHRDDYIIEPNLRHR